MIKAVLINMNLGRIKQCSSLLLVALSVICSTAQAQDDNDYLRNTIIKSQNQFSQSKQQYNNQAEPELSGLDAWVDDTELRWKVSDFDQFEDQQVSYKVSLKNGEQVDAERDILQLGEAKTGIKQSMILQNRLKNSYLTIIDMIDQELRQSLLQQQRQFANDDLNHWKSQVLSDNFRADKLLKADLSLDTLWAEEVDNRASLNRYQQSLAGSVVTTRNLVSIQQMLDITQHVLRTKSYEKHSPLVQKALLDNGIAERQQHRSYAQQNLALKSVKILYDNKDDAFGAEVGVNIPLTRNSFETAQKRQSAYYASLDVDNTRADIAEQLSQKQFVLFRLQDQWLSNQGLLNRLATRIKRVSQTGDLQLVLTLKNKQVSYQKNQNQILVRALKQYISFLHNAGLLAVTPYRNWLKVGTPRIL